MRTGGLHWPGPMRAMAERKETRAPTWEIRAAQSGPDFLFSRQPAGTSLNRHMTELRRRHNRIQAGTFRARRGFRPRTVEQHASAFADHGPRWRERLGEITTPTLVLHGENPLTIRHPQRNDTSRHPA